VVSINPSEKYCIIKSDDFPRDRDENNKIFELPPPVIILYFDFEGMILGVVVF